VQYNNELNRAVKKVFGDDFTNYTWTLPIID